MADNNIGKRSLSDDLYNIETDEEKIEFIIQKLKLIHGKGKRKKNRKSKRK